MSLNIRPTRIVGAILLAMITALTMSKTSFALTEEHMRKFSQNDIMFYDPDECKDGEEGGTCGNSAKEIYWTALEKVFGKVGAAGILGNIMNEGGFNPVSVESCTDNNPFDFSAGTWASGWSWDEYFNSTKTSGVGAFGITTGRNDYLHHVQEKAPNLIEYFQHPETYSFGGCSNLDLSGSTTAGDALRQKIGGPNFEQLVSIEIEWMQKMLQEGGDFNMDEFKAITDAGDAAVYFSMHYEKCAGCLDAGSSENEERRSAGKKAFDEMQDFVCSGTIKAKGYNYTDEEIRGLVRAAISENSCSLGAIKNELSIMANLTEKNGNGKSIMEYIQPGGWFAAAAWRAYNSGAAVSEEQFQAGIDVIKNGNRTFPAEIDEHDCLGDISAIDFDGTGNFQSFSGAGGCSGSAQNVDKSRFKSGVTKLKNAYGSTYTFYAWAGAPDSDCGDPFGYTSGNPTPMSGTSSSSSDSGSSSPASKVTPAKITLIGDSVSVMSENALKEKFPEGILNMVVSRHLTTPGNNCNDDPQGGLGILTKMVSTGDQLPTQHADNTCGTTSGKLTDSVVWALGANPNGASEETLNEVLKQVGSKRKLYLVTPYDGGSKAAVDKVAELYRSFAAKNDNVYIIEWNKAVRDNESKYLLSDHVHPNEEGQKQFADLISQATASSEVCTSSNGGQFVLYEQCDSAWHNSSHGNTCSWACGEFSFAMMATMLLGHEITPIDVLDKFVSLGGHDREPFPWEMTGKLAQAYGLEYEDIYETQHLSMGDKSKIIETINKYLKDGWMIHTSGLHGPFGDGNGHVIGIIELTSDNKWMLADSGWGNSNKPWEPMDVVNNMAKSGNIKAIRGPGSSNNSDNCNEICEEESTNVGGLVAGGMNKAQADAFMAEYRNWDPADAMARGWVNDAGCTGGPLSNCVAFSQYFVNRFTTKPISGLPNGVNVVSRLIQHGFKDGGTIPKVYAVFSKPGPSAAGHTGVVLGIDTDRQVIIIGEAGCSTPPEWTQAREFPLSEYTNSIYTYAYTDEFLNMNPST